nr:protein kinase [Sorangium cellulosum]
MDVGGVVKHYELIRKLGQGGMGTVFLARDTKLGRLVAIKFLVERSGKMAERFLAEARATARCKHESIVIIHEVDEHGGYPYMVLEYVEGQTLREWMTERARAAVPEPLADRGAPTGLVPPGLAVELMIPVVRALICAHQLGIVHRDLKPENVLLDDAGPVKVVDFGIAKQIDTGELPTVVEGEPALSSAGGLGDASTARLDRADVVAGTPAYMSPEQWLARSIDHRADIWAVGIMLHELVTGEHPLEPFSLARVPDVVDLDLPMPGAGERRAGLGALGQVIDRCLQKRATERIGSAKELLAELEALLPDRKALDLRDDESPFAGLAPFQEADAPRFFGRDRDIAAAARGLCSQRLLAVAGPSGAGKSSFVRAGVIPALKRSGDRWETFVLRPGRRPLSALCEALAQAAGATPRDPAAVQTDLPDREALVATVRGEPGYLGARLRARCSRQGPRHRILLFVDQFEELYTLGASPEERRAFVACLEGVADDASSPLRVILAIRSDYLDRVADERHFMNEVTRGLSFLSPMRREGLREALMRPVEAAGHRFEEADMVEHMLGTLASTPSPLPLLQFTATKLWEARDSERRLLTWSSYHRLGGVAGALSAHADAVLSGLSSREQRLARSVLLRLVTPERTRAVVGMEELFELAPEADGDGRGAIEQVIHQLSGARLLHIETSGEREGPTVELVHESLIERWPKLGQWLDESGQDAQLLARLRAASQQWESSGRPDGLLWRDRAAQDAWRWYERCRAEQGADLRLGLGRREERYLAAVVALLERTRRLRRTFALTVIAALGAIAIVVSYLAIRAEEQATRAEGAATRAHVEALQARNATRMATARELEADPTLVLAILREVEPPDVPRGWSVLARWALNRWVARAVLTHPEGVTRVGCSPDGKRIVTASQDRLVRIWDADGTREPLLLRGHDDWVDSAAFSPDGTRIVTAAQDTTARVWRADGAGEPLVLRGHEGRVFSAAFSPDGTRIVTASQDTTARVWRADGAGEPLVLQGHEGRVYSAAFSPDGTRIVTASQDRTARVWRADGAGEPLVLRGHGDRVSSAAFSPDGTRIVTASQDRTARVWDLRHTKEAVVLRGHEHGLSSAAFSPDGWRVITTSFDRSARIWSVDGTGEPLVLRGHGDAVMSSVFGPDGTYVVTASQDRTARVWAIDHRDEPLVLRGHEHWVSSAVFSPDGRRIVTASQDRTARVWSADGTGEPLVLRGHEDRVSRAAFSPDGRRIVTASQDRTARVWSADGTGEPLVLRGHEDRVSRAAFSPDGRRIVTASQDRTARVWSADGTGEPLVLRGHEDRVSRAAFSPDGRRIVTASQDRTARVWSADGTGEPLVLRGHEDRVSRAAFSPDGRRIVTASQDRTARVWSADGTGEPLVLRGHEDRVSSAAFSPDGRRIVTASQDRTARVWNADGTGEPLVLRGHEHWVFSAAFSPDGRRIVTASQDRTARVWRAADASELLVLRGHDDGVLGASFSPDGARIVTASWDATVRVWNAAGTAEPLTLLGHEHWVHAAVFSPDGERIVSASQDTTIRVWSADGSGEPLVLRGSDSPVNDVAFSPDGKRIVSASDDSAVQVWSDLAPLRGTDDPALWIATTYCMPVDRRIELFRVTEATARASWEACRRRVEEARAAERRAR